MGRQLISVKGVLHNEVKVTADDNDLRTCDLNLLLHKLKRLFCVLWKNHKPFSLTSSNCRQRRRSQANQSSNHTFFSLLVIFRQRVCLEN